jgi:hypothetical protein
LQSPFAALAKAGTGMESSSVHRALPEQAAKIGGDP